MMIFTVDMQKGGKMAKAEELLVEIKTALIVSDEMAERCLKLLEIWQTDNPDKYIEGKEILTDNGRKIVYRICVR